MAQAYVFMYFTTMEILTITEARKELMSLPERLSKKNADKALQITQHGKPSLALMPWSTYERMTALITVLSNPDVLKDIKSYEASKNDLSKETEWAHVKAELGL